jgi:hypothetical protein
MYFAVSAVNLPGRHLRGSRLRGGSRDRYRRWCWGGCRGRSAGQRTNRSGGPALNGLPVRK